MGAKEKALHNVDFSVSDGTCVVLCGKSGCGKTTLTRFLNGLIPGYFKGNTEGSCEIFGMNGIETPIEAYVPIVGSVFQNPKTQYFNTNTTAELAFPCENTGMESEKIQKRVEESAHKFHIEELLDRSIYRLSGGQKQKIAFCAATMLSPKLLVLDEPTSNLDAPSIEELKNMILQMKRDGVTIVMAEHRLAWAKDFADLYVFMESGTIKEIYGAKEFETLSDEHLLRMGMRTNNLTPYRLRLEEKMVDQVGNKQQTPLLRLEHLVVGYSKKTPVREIEQMSFYPGEIVGIMGPNGAGKSTLIKTMCGLLKPLSGDICWNGKKAKRKELLSHSFLVMQDVNYQLFSDSVREEVMLDTQDEEKCELILGKLGLLQFAKRHPMSLSGGQKQRVAIASAMVSAKQLIFMDEPTSGLDRYHMFKVGELLQDLKKQGKTVVVITHDEELAADWCDRVQRLVGD